MLEVRIFGHVPKIRSMSFVVNALGPEEGDNGVDVGKTYGGKDSDSGPYWSKCQWP